MINCRALLLPMRLDRESLTRNFANLWLRLFALGLVGFPVDARCLSRRAYVQGDRHESVRAMTLDRCNRHAVLRGNR